jgi:hypothetical protein
VRIMCEDGEPPAGGVEGVTGAVGAFGELGAGCDGGGMGLGSGCCANAGETIVIDVNAANSNDFFICGITEIFVAMIFLR